MKPLYTTRYVYQEPVIVTGCPWSIPRLPSWMRTMWRATNNAVVGHRAQQQSCKYGHTQQHIITDDICVGT